MASFLIKEEPVEHDENNFDENSSNTGQPKSRLDIQIEAEAYYLNKVNEDILNGDDSCEDLAELMSMDMLDDSTSKFNSVPTRQISYEEETFRDNSDARHEKLATEKKLILAALNEQIKQEKDFLNKINSYESLSLSDEAKLLDTLNEFFKEHNDAEVSSLDVRTIAGLRRFRAKLEMRKLKRKNYLKLFNLDTFVNELIDREKYNMMSSVKSEYGPSPVKLAYGAVRDLPMEDEDIIFQGVTLKTCESEMNSGCEIIELERVLDRFNDRKFKFIQSNEHSADNRMESSHMPIGIVEFRNEDVKCLISPYTKKILKPYVRRDYESLPLKLNLNREIVSRSFTMSTAPVERDPIDYVHLRPEHVLQINFMCRQHFWTGIDITECLEYPDHTIVALYRKLIVGFAFLVPNSSYKEAYLSFIFVHPDWRIARSKHRVDESDQASERCDLSIGQYMMFYLIKSSPSFNISLHVSVNSPAIVFYQKFGFKIEEYIKNFYDKYYSDEHGTSKDAFQMKLYCN